MKKFVGFMVGVFIICLIVFAVREYKGQKPLPQQSEAVQEKTVNVTISIPINQPRPKEREISINGVKLSAPGWIYTFGKIENPKCPNPHDMHCLVDRTSQVVGGMLNITYTLPENKETDIGYEIGLEPFGIITANDITANGEPLTSFKVMGTPPNQWVVACFIPWNDSDGKLHISPSPNCTAQSAWHEPSRTRADNISINGVALTSFSQLGQNQYKLACFKVSRERHRILPPLEWFLSEDFDPFNLAFYDLGLGEEQVVIEGADECTNSKAKPVYEPNHARP
ncbi:MAG: hypothetical protein NTX00_03015 [Candidatus Parcubacteria bacterium]|nr:hypothetical protein [Candidatus Parcubacteria bacterium]